MIYVASPYSGTPEEQETRYQQSREFIVGKLREGHHVYSPIVLHHPLALEFDLPKGFEFWRNFDFDMITAANEVWVLCLDGWEHSAGVSAELVFAATLGKLRRYFNADGTER